FPASARAAKIMSRCCRTSPTGTSISALTPRTPIVPFMLASQPGAAIVNCHGSLCVIVGGAVSFGCSSNEPALIRPTIANSAPVKKSSFALMGRILRWTTGKSEKIYSLSVDPHDLGALEPKACHQTLLIENEGVDPAMQGISAETASHSFINDDDARAGANLPAAGVVYPVHSFLVHQKKSIAIFLNTRLQTIRRCHCPIAASGLTVHEKDSLAALRANDEPSFHHIWKHKNGCCLRFSSGSSWILSHELLQSAAGVAH